MDGKIAVVTGGNRGLGRAFAHALGDAGATVAIVARDAAASGAVVDELTAAGFGAIAVPPMSATESVAEVAEQIAGEQGRVDILVNNAGACVHRPALEVTDDEWDEVMRRT